MYGMKPRGLFGANGWTPGINPGANNPMFPQETIQHPMTAHLTAPEEEKKRWLDGGKFQAKDALGMALGAVGDAFSRRPNTANMILGSFQQQREAQQAEQNRQRDWEDFTKQYDYKRNNPMPGSEKPTSLQQNYDWLIAQGRADEAENLLKRNTDPIQWITGPDGIPRPFSMGGQAPTAPVGKLTPIGGPASAPGGFPGR